MFYLPNLPKIITAHNNHPKRKHGAKHSFHVNSWRHTVLMFGCKRVNAKCDIGFGHVYCATHTASVDAWLWRREASHRQTNMRSAHNGGKLSLKLLPLLLRWFIKHVSVKRYQNQLICWSTSPDIKVDVLLCFTTLFFISLTFELKVNTKFDFKVMKLSFFWWYSFIITKNKTKLKQSKLIQNERRNQNLSKKCLAFIFARRNNIFILKKNNLPIKIIPVTVQFLHFSLVNIVEILHRLIQMV